MNNSFGVNFVCSQCSKSLSKCQCVQSNSSISVESSGKYVSSTSGTYGGCYSCGNPLGQCVCNNYLMNTCSVCGNFINQCICAPVIQPTVNPYQGISTTGIYPTTKYDCRIFDIEKNKLDSCGQFLLEEDNKTHGIYGKMFSVELPMEFENCFFHLREDYKNLWQIRTPLTFRIDLERNDKREVKFFALIKFFELKNYENRLVLHEVEFQEVKNNLEVTRLIEIQRIFTKLLRRI